MNFISPVFVCFRWWRSCEGGCFPKLNTVTISTHFHPTMCFSLYKTPYLSLHPPVELPFLRPCTLQPALWERSTACLRRKKEQGSRRWAAMLFWGGSLRATSKRKLHVSGKPNVTQLCAGPSTESCVLLMEGYKQPGEAVGWQLHSRDKKKNRPESEYCCTVSPTERSAHRNLLRLPSALSQTPCTGSDLLPGAIEGC